MGKSTLLYILGGHFILSINRISATVYAPNIASQKVLLKNGFRQEGTIRKGVYKNNEYYDLYYFGKLKEEM